MRTLRNENFTVEFENESDFAVTNKFGDEYKCRLESGHIISKSQLGLKYAMAARRELGF